MLISIIIPCYNEKKNIEELLNRFSKLKINNGELELILVNNGSTDNSNQVLSAALPKYSFARLVTIEKNEGYGNGILEGIRVADGQYIGWMHADMQTAPEELDVLLEELDKRGYPQKVFLKGLRKRRPLSDVFFTICMGIFESIYLGTFLFDINAQPTLFSRELLENCKNPPKDFSLDLYMYYCAKKSGFSIIRHAVKQAERKFGVSSWNTGMASRIKLTKRVVSYSASLKKNVGG